MSIIPLDIGRRSTVQITSWMVPDIRNQAINVKNGKMRPGIPPRDQDLVRGLVLVDVVDGGDALPHAVADLG